MTTLGCFNPEIKLIGIGIYCRIEVFTQSNYYLLIVDQIVKL